MLPELEKGSEKKMSNCEQPVATGLWQQLENWKGGLPITHGDNSKRNTTGIHKLIERELSKLGLQQNRT